MITTTINLYKFSELSEEVQAKVIERNRYLPDAFIYESDVIDEWKQEARNFGLDIPYKNIRYSGFGSQGDGASFTCSHYNFDITLFFTAIGFGDYLNSLKPSIRKIFENNIYMNIERISDRYYHNNTVRFEVELEDHLYNYPKLINILTEAKDFLQELGEDFKDHLCLELYNELEKQYQYCTSDDFIWEYLEDDDFHKYTEDGEEIYI